MNYWLRLYTGILDDPKVQRLPAEYFKGWINLLCLAKENDGLLPSIEDTAFRLRTTEAEAQSLVEELAKRGLLDDTDDGITPHNWDGRQFKSDAGDGNAAERMRRYRLNHPDASIYAHRTDTVTETVTPSVSDTVTETVPQSRDRAETEQSRVPSRAKPRSASVTQSDDDWLAELQANPAYAMLDVRQCYHRMVAWCANNRKQPTRRRFINWLNHEDKPMAANGRPAQSDNGAAAAYPPVVSAPANYRQPRKGDA